MVDNIQLTDLINKDPLLKFKFRGCYSSDTFPNLSGNEFVIVNTDPYDQPGEHWLLIASKQDTILLYDSFGRDFQQYFGSIYNKVKMWTKTSNQTIYQYKPSATLVQPSESQFCGIYCIFVAHFYYRTKKSLKSRDRTLEFCSFPAYATEDDILRFLTANF